MATPTRFPSLNQQKEIEINGVKIKLAATKKVITDEVNALYPKKLRKGLTPEKLNELFDKAVSKSQTKYDVLDLKIADPDKLEDTYDLEMAISRTKSHHIKYDMHDVFTIVRPNADPTKYEFINLYEHYSQLTERDVANSNEWYATMTDGDENEWFVQNLKLTHEHMVNNTEDHLVTKINETYYAYSVAERGGPLFFKIMMDILQNNSQEAATYLVNVVTHLKITDFEGENVDKVVSLIRGAVNRLENLKTKTGKNGLPEDFTESLIKVFKTSSVPAFNSLFEHFSISTQISAFQGASNAIQLKDILRFAELQYRKLSSTNEWTGVKTKANQSVFNATTHKKVDMVCFNCGGKHALKECTQPQNLDRIKANRKKFWDSKRASQKPKGTPGSQNKQNSNSPPKSKKWDPPTTEEKKNRSRRIIDGKEYYYHFRDRRWKLVDTSQTPNPSANQAAAAALSAQSVVNPPSTIYPAFPHMVHPTQPDSSNISVVTEATKQAAIANAAKQVENTFRGLLSQF